ncbi:MAG: hypothetical protein KTR16_07085 [Acidiferrobacterales bacterium]|nr:hypothetical protein [Acidiferrobacterales bacterium]
MGAEFYRKIFTTAFLTDKKDFVGGYENGALFHMVVTAYYHLQYEAGTETAKPIEVERTYSIPLFDSLTASKPFQDKAFQRRVDIVLKGDGAGKETWVETKSYKTPFDPKRYVEWNFTKGKQANEDLDDGESRAIHRQFFLDRVATQTINETRKLGGDLQWWFHGFKRKTIEGYKTKDIEKARDALSEFPSGANDVIASSLGVVSTRLVPSVDSKIDIFTVKTAILEAFKSKLFEELDETELDQLVLNSSHDL